MHFDALVQSRLRAHDHRWQFDRGDESTVAVGSYGAIVSTGQVPWCRRKGTTKVRHLVAAYRVIAKSAMREACASI